MLPGGSAIRQADFRRITDRDSVVAMASDDVAPAKKAAAKKAPAKKAAAKKAPANKAAAKRAPATRTGNEQPTTSRPASNTTRELDVVVYGATGFVGRLLAEYMLQHAPKGVRIGLAGRTESKLAQVRRELGPGAAEWPLIVADAADPDALAALVRSTKVVASTVGPYAKYGLPLVRACAENGTDYVDLTGEVIFVRACADQFDETARLSGARIVNSCGFDSIPSDLGVFLTFEAAAREGAGGLTDTQLVVTSLKGGASGGTIDSLRNQLDVAAEDPAIRRLLVDPFALSPDRQAEPPMASDSRDNDSLGVRYDPDLQMWTGPFVMASYNTRIVRRSNALLNHAYGPDFHYSEVTGFGTSPMAPVMAAAMTVGLAGLVAGMTFTPTRFVLDKVLPAPGEGPSEETRRNGHFRLEVHAATESGRRLRTVVAAKGDPGYAATVVMLGESALCLALDSEVLPDRSGILTPAVAMGNALADRLRAAGFTLKVESLS